MGSLPHLIILSLLFCTQQTVGLSTLTQWELDTEPFISDKSITLQCIDADSGRRFWINYTIADTRSADTDLDYDYTQSAHRLYIPGGPYINLWSATFDSNLNDFNIDVRVESEKFAVPPISYSLTSTGVVVSIHKCVLDPPISQGINRKIIPSLRSCNFLPVSISWAAEKILESSNPGIHGQQSQSDGGGRDCTCSKGKRFSSILQNKCHRLRLCRSRSNRLQVEYIRYTGKYSSIQ